MHVAALERTVRAFRLIFVCGLPLLLCLLLLTGQSPAEDPNRFLRVQEWVGTFTAEFKNSLTIEGSHGVFRGTTEWSLNGSVKLKRKVTIKGGIENMWIGDGTATLTVNQEGTDMSSVGYQTSTKGSGQSTLTERGDGPTPIFQPFLLVNPFGKTYSLNFGYAGIQADDV